MFCERCGNELSSSNPGYTIGKHYICLKCKAHFDQLKIPASEWFARFEEEKKTKAEAQRLIEEEKRKKKALAEMLITSGFHFDGYRIIKYSGYISGDDAISVDRGVAGVLLNTAANVQSKLMDSLKIIRRNALQELKEAAYDLGCNAVIGVDFDYINLDPQTANWNGGTTYLPYVFGVTANGNAVIIEKIEDDD